jgi:hypothetical protein
MSYIVRRGRWCNSVIWNVHALIEGKIDASKDSFYEELEQVFDRFPKYHTKIRLGDFSVKLGTEDTVFSNRHLGIRVYIRIVMIMVLE